MVRLPATCQVALNCWYNPATPRRAVCVRVCHVLARTSPRRAYLSRRHVSAVLYLNDQGLDFGEGDFRFQVCYYQDRTHLCTRVKVHGSRVPSGAGLRLAQRTGTRRCAPHLPP